MMLIALLVRASLGRNAILRQQQIGIHGGSFDIFKFRTALIPARASAASSAVEPRRAAIAIQRDQGADEPGRPKT